MRERIKICRIITRLIVGGAQQTALNLSAHLDPARFETLLVAGPQTGAEGSLFEEAERRGVRVRVVPHLQRRLDPIRYSLALRALRRIIAQESPHIVHTHSTEAGILGRVAARREGVPLIVHTVHGWGFHDHMNRVLRTANIWVEKRVARYTDRLAVVTRTDREKGLRAGIGRPDQYVVIRSAVDLKSFRARDPGRSDARKALGLPADRPIVGTVGRLSQQKDPQAFVRMAKRVTKEIPEALFCFVGDGPLRGHIDGLVSDLGLRGDFVLMGLRPNVPTVMAALDLFTLTSRWEGLPRALIEAMASGLPVVVPSVDGIAEVVQDGRNGILVPAGDEDHHAAAILRVLREPDLKRSLGAAASDSVDEFDLNQMLRQTAELYESLVAPVGGG